MSYLDDEFVHNVEADIKEYTNISSGNDVDKVLVFPPFNSYRRFLVHKASEQYDVLATFSIGFGEQRRTVICRKDQLRATLPSSEEKNYTSKSYFDNKPKPSPFKSWRSTMGIERQSANDINDRSPTSGDNGSSCIGTGAGLYRPPALRKQQQSALLPPTVISNAESSTAAVQSVNNHLSSRSKDRRRPDRAVYVPRARRSGEVKPNCEGVLNEGAITREVQNDSAIISFDVKTEMEHDKVVDTNQPLDDVQNTLKREATTAEMVAEQDTEKVQSEGSGEIAIEITKDSVIPENEVKIKSEVPLKSDKGKSMKGDVSLAGGKTAQKAASKEVPDAKEDDWDSMFTDNGDCLDPKVLDELTAAVGKVTIVQPTMDYQLYETRREQLKEEEYPHVLEISQFPAEFKTSDLMMLFTAYKDSGFEIKWVDDTHALVIFSSAKIAAEVLATKYPVRLKRLAEATPESRGRAKRCGSELQPYKSRPETCAALARRLVTGALGVKVKTNKETLENERKLLREAKERKLLAAKQRDEIWDS